MLYIVFLVESLAMIITFLCFLVVTLLSVAIYLLDAYISVYEIVTTERRE